MNKQENSVHVNVQLFHLTPESIVLKQALKLNSDLTTAET